MCVNLSADNTTYRMDGWMDGQLLQYYNTYCILFIIIIMFKLKYHHFLFVYTCTPDFFYYDDD